MRPIILVVDDSPENLHFISNLLHDEYKIKVAKNGEKALRIAQSDSPPDLILLDIMMPEMDGYEVCQSLKSDPLTKDIPVLFLTAKSEMEDEIKGLGLGAVDYITKPISPAIVKARIKTHLLIQQQRENLQKQNKTIARELRVTQELLREASVRVEGELLGESSTIRKVREAIEEHVKDDCVLLYGPNGAGDEAIARSIHHASSRKNQVFISLNCRQMREQRALENTVILSDSDEKTIPQLELADSGTIYLIHVEKLPEDIQEVFLKILQEIEEARITGKTPRIDVKIIAYTSSNLAKDIEFNSSLRTLLMKKHH